MKFLALGREYSGLQERRSDIIMKISVICKTEFIRKNLMENLKNIRDGKNRTRTSLSISEVLDHPGADTAIVFPEKGEELPDAGSLKAERIIWVFNKGDERYEELYGTPLNKRSLIYRSPSVTGKWDDSDSILPVLCRAAAEDLPYPETDTTRKYEVLFIEDMAEELLNAIEGRPHRDSEGYCCFPDTFSFAPGEAMDLLNGFKRLNSTLVIPPEPKGSLSYRLFSMYLSFLPERKMIYPVKMNPDNRGVFSELIKTKDNGQVSINIARPGITRGQHWHNSKWEIFIVVSGHGLIQERKIGTDEVISFEVRGEDMRAVIMLPGYTHSITNLEKDRDLVTIMYANESFDPERPDTYFEEV